MTEFENVSVAALVQSPEMYDGQAVRVSGLCSFQMEFNAIWSAPENMAQLITKNGIWLSVGRDARLLEYDGTYMVIEGVFSAQNRGHLGLWSGAIETVSRLEPQKG